MELLNFTLVLLWLYFCMLLCYGFAMDLLYIYYVYTMDLILMYYNCSKGLLRIACGFAMYLLWIYNKYVQRIYYGFSNDLL